MVSLHVWCVLYAHSTYESQKRTSDLLELELETVVSCHVGPEPQSSVRAASALPAEPSLQPLPEPSLAKRRMYAFSLVQILISSYSLKSYLHPQ